MRPLTDTEKSYLDTIKQTARGPRPEALALRRASLDGREVAVIVQQVIDRGSARVVGYQPLAIVCDPEMVERLVDHRGDPPITVDPRGVEGAG